MRPLKLKRIGAGPILFGGWVIVLLSAAILLPRDVPNVIAFPIIVLLAIWFLLSVVALFIYLYRAWRRVGAVSNKAAYIAWLSIESAFALAAVAGIVWFLVTPS
jgi:hypothetical protein